MLAQQSIQPKKPKSESSLSANVQNVSLGELLSEQQQPAHPALPEFQGRRTLVSITHRGQEQSPVAPRADAAM
jgi:hypothetical protein